MHFRNLTPHAVALIREDGSTRIVEPERPAARIATTQGKDTDTFDGVPICGPPAFDRIDGLPDRRPDTLVIVSQLTALIVAATLPGRSDVVYPATGRENGATRDKGGTLAVRRLIRAC